MTNPDPLYNATSRDVDSAQHFEMMSIAGDCVEPDTIITDCLSSEFVTRQTVGTPGHATNSSMIEIELLVPPCS